MKKMLECELTHCRECIYLTGKVTYVWCEHPKGQFKITPVGSSGFPKECPLQTILELRENVSVYQAEEEIMEFIDETNDLFYPSELMENLRIDYETICSALENLRRKDLVSWAVGVYNEESNNQN